MKVPCVICGKESFADGLCDECWLKRKSLFELKDFHVTVCDCGSQLFHGSWEMADSVEKAIEREILRNIKSTSRIKKVKCAIKIVGTNASAEVCCTGVISPCRKEKTETKSVSILIKKAKCEECIKDAASYYEATIQLRVDPLLEKIMQWGKESIVGVKKVQGGFDLFFKSNDVAKDIAERLRKNGYVITKSVVYLARKNNKNIYRKYYSIKSKSNE